ncbi:MAG TPA: Rv3235 family protein [Actinomycetales bacterium]|jgi:hypothetical protein
MTATALRALPVPDTEPPLDASPEPTHGRFDRGRSRGVQGVLSLVVDDDRALVVPPLVDDDPDFGPRRTGTSDLPGAQDWGRRLVQVVVEVMCGQRPAAQLVRWTSQPVYDQVVCQTLPHVRQGPATPRRRARISSVRVCEPVDGVAELSAVVHGQYRVQALAMRMEGRDGRWRVTALETG